MDEKIIDAEFTDVDGVEKGGSSILEHIANVADRVTVALEKFPGAEKAAMRAQQVAFVARETDAVIEEVKPLARKVEASIADAWKSVGLENFHERDVMGR